MTILPYSSTRIACLAIAAALALTFDAASVPAAEAKAASAKDPSPEAEIRATAAAFVKAFDRGDAKGVAELWIPEGTAAEADGTIYKGREAIEKQYAALFKEHPDARIAVAVKSIEFPTPTTAIEDGISQVEAQRAGSAQVARYTAVHIKVDGKWLLASVREANVDLPSNFDKIERLSWLVGDWTTQRDGTRVRTTVRWIANNSFLEREYSVSTDGIVTSSGRQIIGWDPASGQIRSWSFDASGGHGAGIWTETPQGWQIEQRGVTANGTPTSSRDILIRVPGEDNVFGYRSIARTIGDTRLPDLPEVALDRVPAKSAKAK